MPNLVRELKNCKHPNSRKTKALAKQAKRVNNKHKNRLGHAIKSNLIGEKLTWFLEQIGDEQIEALKPQKFAELIEVYLNRFNEELEQIYLRQSISKKRKNQHVARETVIKITVEKEKGSYYGGGLELPNLCDPLQFKALRNWDGNAINVQHIKLDLISENFLKRLTEEDCTAAAAKISETISTPKIIVTASSDDDENMKDAANL